MYQHGYFQLIFKFVHLRILKTIWLKQAVHTCKCAKLKYRQQVGSRVALQSKPFDLSILYSMMLKTCFFPLPKGFLCYILLRLLLLWHYSFVFAAIDLHAVR